MKLYYPIIGCTPVGPAIFLGSTMTDEREREITRERALRDMPRLGLEPTAANLPRYYAMIREVLG